MESLNSLYRIDFGLVALILNLVTLMVVGYQTRLTKNAIRTTDRQLSLSVRANQIEMLNHPYRVIAVLNSFESWLAELERDVSALETSGRSPKLWNRFWGWRERLVLWNNPAIEKCSTRGLDSPRGLVVTGEYEDMPIWLQTLLMAGVQHYYVAKSFLPFLWDDRPAHSARWLIAFGLCSGSASDRIRHDIDGPGLPKLFPI